MSLATIAVLAVGTYAFRIAGPALRGRVRLSTRLAERLNDAALLLLVALIATSALTSGHDLAGWARPLAVLVALALVLRRAPFPVVVVGAALVAAGLRLAGLA